MGGEIGGGDEIFLGRVAGSGAFVSETERVVENGFLGTDEQKTRRGIINHRKLASGEIIWKTLPVRSGMGERKIIF